MSDLSRISGRIPVDRLIPAVAKRVLAFLKKAYGSGVKSVILYGSQVHGTATEDSDVDLLVVVDDSLDPWRVRSSLDDLLFDILLETGELVSVVVVPQSYYKEYASPFLVNVRREGIPV
jgi:predicted nucleotidyltransferase